MEAKILKDTTQTILGYPRISASGVWLKAQASSAEVRIATPSTALPSTFDSATIDTLSTTLSAAALEGATSLTLAGAVALKRNRRYLVADGDGGFIDVESRTEGSSATMRLAEPLPRDLASGAAVKGYALTHALTSGETDQVGECLAMWKAVIDGVTYEWGQTFRIVARMPVCTLTPSALTMAWPSVRLLRTRQDDNYEETIEGAWKYLVYPLLAKHGIDDEDVLSWEALDPLMAIACLYRLSLDNEALGAEQFKKVEDRWRLEQQETFARKDWFTQAQVDDPAAPVKKPVGPAPGLRVVR